MGPPDQDESDLLESGAVDALFHAAEPRGYTEGHPMIARLFPDSRRVEQAYFSRTGIFPIMHAVAIRSDVLEASPWLARAVFNAYSSAKQMAYDYLSTSAWYLSSIPWITQEMEATHALMGSNYWTYGVEPNRDALNALFRYSYQQRLASIMLSIEDLFYPPSLDWKE